MVTTHEPINAFILPLLNLFWEQIIETSVSFWKAVVQHILNAVFFQNNFKHSDLTQMRRCLRQYILLYFLDNLKVFKQPHFILQ